ncbi:MAG: ribbon-helix-helix domain-containing protein [Halodesulfurarchaeum sp.]|nr:ribbon-helix-helix domain-containing protein [Halodesulfurarchaeum sp.]
MSTDLDGGDGRMRKINVRVPETLIEEIEDEWETRGYSSMSEAIRDALRDWVHSPASLSAETLSALEASRQQVEGGETVSLEEVAEKHDVHLDDA